MKMVKLYKKMANIEQLTREEPAVQRADTDAVYGKMIMIIDI